jgi:trehalose 6-phosphate phosphatase
VNIAGIHGFERRLRGDVVRAGDDFARVEAAAEDAQALIDSGAIDARIEDKVAGLAFHFRHAPSAAETVRSAAEYLAERHGLAVLEGKMVVELTLGVRNKGDALAAFMAEAPFLGRTPLAVGDDLTDEDAFAAAQSAGGAGILVGAARSSAARHVLPDAAAVARWLEAGLAS